MTDKELIKEEIERIIDEETPISKGSDYYHGAKESMEKLLKFIDALQEEPVNEDLKEEIEKWLKKKHFIFTEVDEIIKTAHHFAEWQADKDFRDNLKSDPTVFNKVYWRGYKQAQNDIAEFFYDQLHIHPHDNHVVQYVSDTPLETIDDFVDQAERYINE